MISKFIFINFLLKNSLEKEKGIGDQLLHVTMVCTPQKNSEDLVNDKTTID